MQAVVSLSDNRNGVLKVLHKEDRNYYKVDDVMKILGVSSPKAYKVMRALREELISDGKLIEEYPCGRIPKKYFDARCGNE
ncbi:MAG: hypothetical protein ACK5H4_05760 [Lacrimispora sphenoides]